MRAVLPAARIIPGIVLRYILAGFLSVLVLGRDIKRNLTAVEPRHGQILLRCTFEELAVMFEGSTASGAERAYRKAVEKLTVLLVEAGAIVSRKDINQITFSYG